MITKQLKAAIYLRVSTSGQTVENQERDLEAAAERRGWQITHRYADEGLSGAKGRDKRPALDAMLKAAVAGKFDVVMCWAVDRMGRSVVDLMTTLHELHGAKVELFLHQQGLDTTTPSGRAMFGMLGVFADFERSMIVERTNAGLARAKAKGVRLGRPPIKSRVDTRIRDELSKGYGIIKTAKLCGCGVGTVHKIKREIEAATATA